MAVALVTGTSTGIGLATAVTLGRAGLTVFAGMRNPESGGAELRAAIESETLPVHIVKLDVDDDASVTQAVDHALATSGPIDVLVNNAGVSGSSPFNEAPLSFFRQVMETNFFGGLRCIKAVLPSMTERRAGTIINVTSISGRIAFPSQGAYAASKWAMEGSTECLAQELKAFNIRVALIEPGITVTKIFGKGRPVVPNTPYPHRRRIAALFGAFLKAQTSPFVVAEQIRAIVEGDSWQLRYLTGPDAAEFVKWRSSKTDEEWVALGGAPNEEWSADVKRHFGFDVTP